MLAQLGPLFSSAMARAGPNAVHPPSYMPAQDKLYEASVWTVIPDIFQSAKLPVANELQHRDALPQCGW